MSTYNFSTQKELFDKIGSYIVYELKKDEVMKLLGKEFVIYGDILGFKIEDIKIDE